MNISIDYLVVGCGISGLYCAYKHLLGKNYLIIDKNDYIGGRAFTYDFHNIPVQMGAGIIREHDNNILELIKELGLETGSFESDYHFPYMEFYKDNKPNSNYLISLFQKMTEKVKETYQKNKENVKNLSFKNFLELYFDSNFVDKFITNGLYHDYLNASVDAVIDEYPLDEILLTGKHKYYFIKNGGWRGLINKFKEYVKNIKLNTELVKVVYNNDSFKCYCKNGLIINCKKLIFTADISIKNIEFMGIKPYILQHIDGINFMRCYTWHDKMNLKYNYKVTSVLDKIIPINQNILMSCYCDNWKAKQAKELFGDQNPNKVKNINMCLKNSLGKDYELISEAKEIISAYWTPGIHYYKPGYDLDQKDINNKGMYILGEMTSLNQGWVEGCIESINKIKNF